MHDRGRPGAADVLRQPEVSAGDLAILRLTTELTDELDHLGDADRPEGTALRLEATRGVDDCLAPGAEATARELGTGPTLLDEPEVLEGDERADGVSVVDLRDLNVGRCTSRLV